MNDFQPISLLQSRAIPLSAADDLPVPFNRDAFASKLKVNDQSRDRQSVWNLPLLSVEENSHEFPPEEARDDPSVEIQPLAPTGSARTFLIIISQRAGFSCQVKTNRMRPVRSIMAMVGTQVTL